MAGCPGCKHLFSLPASVCPKCGREFSGIEREQMELVESENRVIVFLWVFGLVVVIVLGILGVFER